MPRTRKKHVADWCDESDLPIYLLDRERKIRYCNPACCRWLQVEQDELMGLQCDYHSELVEPDHDRPPLAIGLCPPPVVFAGERATGLVYANGVPEGQSADFIPLGLEESAVLVIVGLASTTPAKDTPFREFDSQRLHELLFERRQQQAALYQLDQLVGESSQMRRVREQVSLAVRGDCPVVTVGMSGTGRAHLIRTIHTARYSKSDVPLIEIDCPLFDADTLASVINDLRRAVEGSVTKTALLMLEIDQLPRDAQATLYQLLQEHPEPSVVYATSSADLIMLAKSEKAAFRSDLADYLCTSVISLPPLSERLDDLPLLIQLAIERQNSSGDKQVQGAAPQVIERLLRHPWTRNLDELFECMSEAHQKAVGRFVTERDLPDWITLTLEAERHPHRPETTIDLENYLQEVERELIRRALKVAKGNKAMAARLLGISRGRLLRRLASLQLEDA